MSFDFPRFIIFEHFVDYKSRKFPENIFNFSEIEDFPRFIIVKSSKILFHIVIYRSLCAYFYIIRFLEHISNMFEKFLRNFSNIFRIKKENRFGGKSITTVDQFPENLRRLRFCQKLANLYKSKW